MHGGHDVYKQAFTLIACVHDFSVWKGCSRLVGYLNEVIPQRIQREVGDITGRGEDEISAMNGATTDRKYSGIHPVEREKESVESRKLAKVGRGYSIYLQ